MLKMRARWHVGFHAACPALSHFNHKRNVSTDFCQCPQNFMNNTFSGYRAVTGGQMDNLYVRHTENVTWQDE